MRLNLGSGELPLHGWTNVDAYLPADVQGDIRELEFKDVEMVYMSHLLEHLPHTQTTSVLMRIRSWMQPDAPITVEVPDMRQIAEMVGRIGDAYLWNLYIYGNQAHEGEVHRAGFTADSLHFALSSAGFSEITVRSFLSEVHYRKEMPCIEAKARA